MEQCGSGPAGLESVLGSADLCLIAGPWVCSLDSPMELADDALNEAAGGFQSTVRQDGMGPGLRTYARTRDFVFYADGQASLPLADANRYFTNHPVLGTFHETARARSADGSRAYSAGEFTDAKHGSSHAYVQIWQYEARVANWGLRVLSINSLR